MIPADLVAPPRLSSTGVSAARTYEEFMAEVAASNPEQYAETAARFPVLSTHQLRRREKREIAVSQFRRGLRLVLEDAFYSTNADEDATEGNGQDAGLIGGY